MVWTLSNRRDPIRARRKLAHSHRAQLAALLEAEGAGTIEQAARDEEWRGSVELVDVVDDGGRPRYQLYLWPSGSGILYRDGTTDRVADIAQHSAIFVTEEPGLREALTEAFDEGRKRLGISEWVDFARARADAPAVDANTGLSERIAALVEGAHAEAKALRAELFGPAWCPYPKRRPASLRPEQRAFLERATVLKLPTEAEHHGMVLQRLLPRYLGLTSPGPSDVTILVDGRPHPLWCAVSDVASGHAEPGPVLQSFRALSTAEALAAWIEMAEGGAYDLAETHPLSMKEAGIARTPAKVKHRTRLFGWLADACVALGEPGRAAAERIARSLPEHAFGHPAFVAALSLSRHAKARREVRAPEHDALLARLVDKRVRVYADPVIREIAKGLPADRAGLLARK